MRLFPCSTRISTGSARFAGGFHSACAVSGTWRRQSAPLARRSSSLVVACSCTADLLTSVLASGNLTVIWTIDRLPHLSRNKLVELRVVEGLAQPLGAGLAGYGSSDRDRHRAQLLHRGQQATPRVAGSRRNRR